MGNKHRNGESYADYLLRRKAELTDEINKLDLYIRMFDDEKKKCEDERDEIIFMLSWRGEDGNNG